MSEIQEQLAVARRFAAALDREDYDQARGQLAAGCAYRRGDAELLGPDAVIAAYRESAEWASAHLDAVVYRSRVELGQDGRFVVRFEDDLTHGGRRHVHACRQFLTLDRDGRIAHIEHEDLPGGREALAVFFREAGIHREDREG
jgi:hypothetical protein